LRGGHPNPTDNWEPDLDYRSSRPQSFNGGGGIAKKILAGEIYAYCHGVPGLVIECPTFFGVRVDYEIDVKNKTVNCVCRGALNAN
jgi:hypothetical protein